MKIKVCILSLFCIIQCTLFLASFSLFVPNAYCASFTYETNGEEDVVSVLDVFANSQGQIADFSEGLLAGEAGTLSGALHFDSEEQFLSFILRNKKIASYSSIDSIYFCLRSEMESMLFNLQGTTVAQLRQKLQSLGLYDKRYPFRSSGSTLFRVTAPSPYIDILSQIVMEIASVEKVKKATKVFKLKYAWADDMTIESVNQSVTVPGIATILREITGNENNISTRTQNISNVQRVASVGSSLPSARQDAVSAQGNNQANNQRQNPENAGGGGGARILADSRLNAVIIWDDADRMHFYEKLIESLDQPVLLVEIRVAIIDVSVSKVRELGIAWSGTDGGDGTFDVSGGINDSGDLLTTVGSGLNLTTVYTNGLNSLMAKVSALETDGDANVLSRPAVLTMDNVQASLENINTFYVDVAGTEVADLFAIEYGTTLQVTPHIVDAPDGGNKLVQLAVRVESGSSSSAPEGGSITIPQVSNSVINTQAMVAENQVLIVGGYYQETVQESVSGVPILMRIPILGRAFRVDSKSKNVVERLFVISPRIVDPRAMSQVPSHITDAMEVSRQLSTQPTQQQTGGCTRKTITVNNT